MLGPDGTLPLDSVEPGTPMFISPEVAQRLLGYQYGQAAPSITTKSDIYSLGLTCMDILVGQLPFDLRQPAFANFGEADLLQDRAFNVINVPLMLSALEDKAVVNIVARMLTFDPINRPSAVELLQVPCSSSVRHCKIEATLSLSRIRFLTKNKFLRLSAASSVHKFFSPISSLPHMHHLDADVKYRVRVRNPSY